MFFKKIGHLCHENLLLKNWLLKIITKKTCNRVHNCSYTATILYIIAGNSDFLLFASYDLKYYFILENIDNYTYK